MVCRLIIDRSYLLEYLATTKYPVRSRRRRCRVANAISSVIGDDNNKDEANSRTIMLSRFYSIDLSPSKGTIVLISVAVKHEILDVLFSVYRLCSIISSLVKEKK